MLNRMIRAARLDVNLYEEVEADKGATVQAMLVVLLTSAAVGVGSLEEGGIGGLIANVFVGVIGWAIWAYANYFIGTRLLKEPQTRADWGELARAMGFASTPRIFSALGVIPIPIITPIAMFLV